MVKRKMLSMATPGKNISNGFAGRLREALLRRYPSVRQAAEVSEIPYKTLIRHTNGTRMPSGAELQKLALVLGDDLFYVLTGLQLEGWRGAALALAVRQLDDAKRHILLRCAQVLAESREDIPSHLAQLLTYIEAAVHGIPQPRRVLRAASHDDARFQPEPHLPPCREP